MTRYISLWRWTGAFCAVASALSLFASQALAAPVPIVSSTAILSPPLAPATKQAPIWITVKFPDPANNAKTKTAAVPIPAPDQDPLTAWNKAGGETVTAASKRKVDAYKAAFDAAVKAGKIPASVIATNVGTVQSPSITKVEINPFTKRPTPIFGNQKTAYYQLQVVGITEPPIYASDTSFQAGTGARVSPLSPGKSAARFNPRMSRASPSPGTATGLDPLGEPSVIVFGFYDDQNGTLEDSMLYIAGVFPEPGEEEADAMQALADVFNYEFGKAGFSANYNSSTGTLSLGQELTWNYTYFFGNSDPGLDFSYEMVPVPEPSTLALALVALFCLPGWGRGRWWDKP